MNSTSQSFNEKVSLIYEYNKSSPLLFRAASTELEKNNPEGCIQIVQNGLKIFPENPLGYILLGRAFGRTGDFESAKENINHAGKLIGSPKTVEFYMVELERLRRNFSSLGSSRGEVFLNLKEEKDNQEVKQRSNEELSEIDTDLKKSIEDNLGNIAKEISTKKFIRSDEQAPKEETSASKISDNQMIVSETMAQILVSQDQLSEAKRIYLKLKEQNPSKDLYYREKIQEIEQKLSS